MNGFGTTCTKDVCNKCITVSRQFDRQSIEFSKRYNPRGSGKFNVWFSFMIWPHTMASNDLNLRCNQSVDFPCKSLSTSQWMLHKIPRHNISLNGYWWLWFTVKSPFVIIKYFFSHSLNPSYLLCELWYKINVFPDWYSVFCRTVSCSLSAFRTVLCYVVDWARFSR